MSFILELRVDLSREVWEPRGGPAGSYLFWASPPAGAHESTICGSFCTGAGPVFRLAGLLAKAAGEFFLHSTTLSCRKVPE